MAEGIDQDDLIAGLNAQQATAVLHGDEPLLIIAGAGTGKTRTLVHRVAHLMAKGVDPRRIMLLTFTRRASGEMLRRVAGLLRQLSESEKGNKRRTLLEGSRRVWGGTFHATAARLLRIHGKSIGLDPGFTIHDRTDSEDLLNVVRTELGLTKTDKRFPKKRTCMSIYSLSVNAQRPLQEILDDRFPWCADYGEDLKRLFQAYVDRKEAGAVLDYDDLLLFWQGLLEDEKAGRKVRDRFDCVLVDEYQDTNHLQAKILAGLRPDGSGMTVVGDDAQSIYSFRAATVRNILDFPQQFADTTTIKLEENYRSTRPILEVTNRVIAGSKERYVKELFSGRDGGEQPQLIMCEDEDEQSETVVHRVLEHREAGIDLKRQAVLFRASHHSMNLEAELARRNIPFVKYGGLKFVETAHVKDLMSFLRLAENPRDLVAGCRVLMLLPGIGPKTAQQLMRQLIDTTGDFRRWSKSRVPAACAAQWPKFIKLMRRLTKSSDEDLSAQVRSVRKFYTPLLEEKYDRAEPRLRDLEQLEQLAGRFADRQTMLVEIALDPPTTTEDFAGPPKLDEDFLILSTMHSAKGLEWDAVYVIHAADGNIPSDMATKSPEQIDEERRLLYVAMTRAKNWLYVCYPQRYFHAYRGRFSDQHGYAQLTRFITKRVKRHFDCRTAEVDDTTDAPDSGDATTKRGDIRRRIRETWS